MRVVPRVRIPPPKQKRPGRALATSKGTYKTIREASKATGIAAANIAARLKLGWTSDQACGYALAPKHETSGIAKEIFCEGARYASQTQLAEAFDLRPALVGKRLRNGWTPEQAVNLNLPPPRYRNADGSPREHSWTNPVVTSEGKSYAGSAHGTYLLYVIENTLNDKKYIGITTTSLSTRFYHHKVEASKKGSRSKLYNAMRKLGVNEFSISILRNDASNIEELLHQETKTILDFDSITNGYNTSTGGTLGTAKDHS